MNRWSRARAAQLCPRCSTRGTTLPRGNVTGLVERTKTGTVSFDVRSVTVALTSIRDEGAANDGYADNLSLVLTGVASPTSSP